MTDRDNAVQSCKTARTVLTAYETFNILRAVSQNRNVKVRPVAEDVVSRVTGRPPQPPPFDLPG